MELGDVAEDGVRGHHLSDRPGEQAACLEHPQKGRDQAGDTQHLAQAARPYQHQADENRAAVASSISIPPSQSSTPAPNAAPMAIPARTEWDPSRIGWIGPRPLRRPGTGAITPHGGAPRGTRGSCRASSLSDLGLRCTHDADNTMWCGSCGAVQSFTIRPPPTPIRRSLRNDRANPTGC